MELHPNIWFSESELEQAGLLDVDVSYDIEPSPELGSEVGDHQQQQFFCTLQSPPTGTCSLADRLQTLADCWQVPCLGGPSSSSLHESTATQCSTLSEDVVLHEPPLPEEAPQRWNKIQQPAAAEHITNTQQDRSMPTDSAAVIIRKQANRDHQKKFRMRQKVLFTTRMCLLLFSNHSRMCQVALSRLHLLVHW